jgi:hypothetical protein
MNVGINECMKFGTTSTKNHVTLSNVNITQGFCMLQVPNEKKKKDFLFYLCYWTDSILSILSINFMGHAFKQGGMDLTEACSTWKCMIMLSKVSMDNICTKKFECTRQKSWLRNFRS